MVLCNQYIRHFLLIFICMGLFGLALCNRSKEYLELGATNDSAKTVWVYLCGLLTDVPVDLLEEWKTIDRIGKDLGITFLAVLPKYRCPRLNNALCWPCDSREELKKTWQDLETAIGDRAVAGYIGFSNGGFFLNRLAQQMAFEKPIISIGAAGPLKNKAGPRNSIDFMISKDDVWHYEPAIAFYNDAKGSNLKIALYEYKGGHIVPYNELKAILKHLS